MKKGSYSRNGLWQFFASVKLSLTLFFLLAVTSIVGTLIPQNQDHALYLEKFGERLYHYLLFFNLFDMYHATWFQFLLLLLSINIIICSIDRLLSTWKILFPKVPKYSINQFQKGSIREEFKTPTAVHEIRTLYEDFLGKKYGQYRADPSPNGFYLFMEKGRWTRLGVYGVHLSVLFMLAGAMVGSIFGFEGYLKILEGDTENMAVVRQSDETIPLPFDVRCDAFDMSYYKTGEVKEFRSDLTLLKDGTPLLKDRVIVNHPLRYRGISLYQSAYGTGSPTQIKVRMTHRQNGKQDVTTVELNEDHPLPGNAGTFVLKDMIRTQGMQKGQRLFIGLLDAGKDAHPIEIKIAYPLPAIDLKDEALIDFIDQYQYADRHTPPTRIDLAFTSQKTGLVYSKSLTIGDTYELPEQLGTFQIKEYTPAFDFRGFNLGEALLCTLTNRSSKSTSEEIVLPLNKANFDRMRKGTVFIQIEHFERKGQKGDYIFEVLGYQERAYTVLQVTKDPGVFFVYLGFILMIIGCYITFFMAHQKFCIEFSTDKQSTIVHGKSNKNRLGMRLPVRRLKDQLSQLSNVK